jgi:hypothetical protein
MEGVGNVNSPSQFLTRKIPRPRLFFESPRAAIDSLESHRANLPQIANREIEFNSQGRLTVEVCGLKLTNKALTKSRECEGKDAG